AHPVPRVTVAGGVAKITKLAQGLLDLHSKRGAVDLEALARFADIAGGSAGLRERIVAANTAAEAFSRAEAESIALGDVVARAVQMIEGRDIAIEVVVFDRDGRLVGRADFAAAHAAPPRNRRR